MRRQPGPAWLDDPTATVTLAEVRASIAFEKGLAEPKAEKKRPEKRDRGPGLDMKGEA